MKKQKRNLQERAYQRGYSAGLGGRNRDNCPHTEGLMRSQWLSGWHEVVTTTGMASASSPASRKWPCVNRINDSSTRSARRRRLALSERIFYGGDRDAFGEIFSQSDGCRLHSCRTASVDWRSALIPTINPTKHGEHHEEKPFSILGSIVLVLGLAACGKKKNSRYTDSGSEQADSRPKAAEAPARWKPRLPIPLLRLMPLLRLKVQLCRGAAPAPAEAPATILSASRSLANKPK